MEDKVIAIGIDSLDPYIILKYRKDLPTLSKLITESPTFISKSVFPVDTIPAWVSIYTGLHPGNHGVVYVYDVFDPNLSNLRKLDINHIKGRTFYDYANQEGFKTIIAYPILLYPAWEIDGIIVSKSPFERRVDWIRTEIDIDVYPNTIKQKYKIADKFVGLWGGFPGIKYLKKWAELGKEIIEKEKSIGIELCKNEKWDLFFIYFSLLDIVQHRLWRFFDEDDPTYPGQTSLRWIILDYYKMFDGIIEEFIKMHPDKTLIVISDHGHRSRPIKTVNINEYLRRRGFLTPKGNGYLIGKIQSKIKKIILDCANKLDIEHWLIKLIVRNQKLTKISKSIYSSAGVIDRDKSIAYLSNFVGLKSYSYGGIEINKDLVSNIEYEKIRDGIIKSLLKLKTPDNESLIKWVKKREELYLDKFNEKIYPDIIFELKEDYSIGWNICCNLYEKAYDHKVASGGHRKDAVFLVRNVNRRIRSKEVSIVDVAPTILDLLGVDWRRLNFDGKSIFGAN